MKVFITGLTGTLGTAIAKIHMDRGDSIIGCSRSELRAKQWESDNSALERYCTLYLTDRMDSLESYILKANVVYHCAAMKHVDLCQEHPDEAININVGMTSYLSALCAENDNIRFVFASTDKACLPQNIYGATKLLGEQLVAQRGGCVIRLGNLIGSSGSVFELWKKQLAKGERLKVTSLDMTRYFIDLNEAANVMVNESIPNRVVAPVMKAACIGDVVQELTSYYDVVGLRSGETQHQWLIAPREKVIYDAKDCHPIGQMSRDASKWNVRELLKIAGVL